MPGIDFLIIGAQKAGTTSLFEYMRRHPQIHMPAEKEVGFFNVERSYRRGKDWYLSTMLRDAPPHAVCGEASVGYMRGTPFGDLKPEEFDDLWAAWTATEPLERVIPRRIVEMLPDAKLICVLRDPVERAYSQYRMEVLNRAEDRSFEEAVEQLMEPSALRQARIAPTRTNSYIVGGEYFRILSGFLSVLPSERLMTILSPDLVARPRETLAGVFEFVGVTGDYVPDNLNTRYRAAAVKQRVVGLDLYAWQRRIARVGRVRTLWHALPRPIHDWIDRSYRTASFRVAMWNARRDAADHGIAPATKRQLAAHFRPDSQALAEILGMDIPWLADWEAQP